MSFDRSADNLFELPRLMVAAPRGKSGKTTVSIAICAGLVKRGQKVQPFKKGPDFIDPSWLKLAAGRVCFNLDSHLMTEEDLVSSFQTNCEGADIAVVEGAMGLFDGWDWTGKDSSSNLARLLKIPIILVIDVTRMTRSVAALLNGYLSFEKGIEISGVILNNVSNNRHRETLRKAIEHFCGIPIVGCIFRNPEIEIAQRNLGLIPTYENRESKKQVQKIVEIIDGSIDFDLLQEIALKAKPILSQRKHRPSINMSNGFKIGVFYDKIFNFYYPDNLQALENEGATLLKIDTLSVKSLPDLDALYIGGGFPERFAKEISDNSGLRNSVAFEIERGLPVYAECGGLIFLCRSITYDGHKYDMAGIIDAEVMVENKPIGHGYMDVTVIERNPYFKVNEKIKGHEFHYSRIYNVRQANYAFRVDRGQGTGEGHDGIIYKNMLASFMHLHSMSYPSWAAEFMLTIKNRPQTTITN